MLLVTALAAAPQISAQSHDASGSMLVATIAGHRYERTAFDSSGQLTGKAVIEVGSVAPRGESVEVPLSITTYSPAGGERGQYRSLWRCSAGQEMMIMPLVFLSEESNRELRLEAEGDAVLYPAVPSTAELPDVRLTLRKLGGAFGFFGGRSVIRLTNRRVERLGEQASDGYRVISSLEIKAFVLGIRVRSLRFESREIIDPGHGLVHQTLTAPNGARSVLTVAPD